MINLNPVGDIAEEVMGGLDDLFTSDEERINATAKLKSIMQKPHILQAMANIQEAKHKSVFVAGWRPAIGWVCVIGLAYQFLLLPFVTLIAAFLAPEVIVPSLDAGVLMTLVLSLLGLGGYRTYEKKIGVASDSMEKNSLNTDVWGDDIDD
jgi:hypothetical protein